MEWFLIIGGIVFLLAKNSRKNRRKSKKAPPQKTSGEPSFSSPVMRTARQSFESKPAPRSSSVPARWVQPGEQVRQTGGTGPHS